MQLIFKAIDYIVHRMDQDELADNYEDEFKVIADGIKLLDPELEVVKKYNVIKNQLDTYGPRGVRVLDVWEFHRAVEACVLNPMKRMRVPAPAPAPVPPTPQMLLCMLACSMKNWQQ